MNKSSLKDEIKKYLIQQVEVYGDIVLKNDQNFGKQKISLINSEVQKILINNEENKIVNKNSSVIENESEKNGNVLDYSSINSVWLEAESLMLLNDKICNCQRCSLANSRDKFVFGSGNENADIVIIGEAPGAEEDKQGLPFVGAAGQLLTKILEAVNFKRDEVYICNILKCRPPENRTPELSEVEKCEPYLIKQLNLIKPKFILALGLTAANTLLKKSKMMDLRGEVHYYNEIPLIITYHPAALLRNPSWKRATWEDVQMLRNLYDEAIKN